MGSMFPTRGRAFYNQFIVLFVLWPVLTRQALGQILPPGNPASRPPPEYDRNNADNDLERKQEQRRIRDRSGRKPVLEREEKRNIALSKDAVKHHELDFMLQVSLVLPYLKTTGNRKNYTADLTSHFHLFYRGTKTPNDAAGNLWWGFRTAMFSGTGIYKNIPGRYGFTYFGPMIGIGKISSAEQAGGSSAAGADPMEDQFFPTRHGWFLMFGIAATSRIVKIDPSELPLDQDFDRSSGVKFDKPGLWTEFTYATVHFGAVGVNLSLGTQFAQGKTFYYTGLGAAGWN
jgi:hypothetical protein